MRNNLQIKKEGYDLRLVRGHVPDNLEQNMQLGIDGLYQNLNSNSNVVFVIDEAKFGNSSLKKTKNGLQMSDSWLLGNVTNKNRILEAVGNDNEQLTEEILDALKKGQVDRVLSEVNVDGIVTTYRLDRDGNIIGIWP